MPVADEKAELKPEKGKRPDTEASTKAGMGMATEARGRSTQSDTNATTQAEAPRAPTPATRESKNLEVIEIPDTDSTTDGEDELQTR